MSLIVTVFVPECIVMASDSRQSVTLETRTPDGKPHKVETINSDAVKKTFLLENQQVGISNAGQDLLGGKPMASHIRTFVEDEIAMADDVASIPYKLVEHFRKSFPDADVGFHVAGYKKEGKASVPHFYYCHIAKNLVERGNLKKGTDSVSYGATWSGQIDVMASILNPVVIKDEKGQDKVIRGPAPVIWDAMALQDAVDFSTYAIRTTIDTMRFQARPKNVGGPISVLLLTPHDKPTWIHTADRYREPS